jgi:zinc transport system substrate-binding protein
MGKFNNLLTATILSAVIISPLSYNVLASTNEIGSTSDNNRTSSSSTISTQNSYLQDKVKVVASFYPIFEFVKKVGGDKVEVSSLIPVGIEPHDFEATIQQIQNAETADILVFNGVGFE